MTYLLRDRPDGQVEIIIEKPILVGIFPERDIAERVCAFLKEDELTDMPEGFTAEEEASVLAITNDLAALAPARPNARVTRTRRRNLPAVVPDAPVAPAFITASSNSLTDDQREDAFQRITAGEKIADVAAAFGLSMAQLRAIWANRSRHLQKYIAEGGKQKCCICAKEFMPSTSNPDSCARCAQG